MGVFAVEGIKGSNNFLYVGMIPNPPRSVDANRKLLVMDLSPSEMRERTMFLILLSYPGGIGGTAWRLEDALSSVRPEILELSAKGSCE